MSSVLQDETVQSPSFEPYTFDSSRLYFSPYLSRKGKGFQVTHLGGKGYHYFYQDWYQIPRETGKSSWSEPYFDEGGGDILMATYSRPVFIARKRENPSSRA